MNTAEQFMSDTQSDVRVIIAAVGRLRGRQWLYNKKVYGVGDSAVPAAYGPVVFESAEALNTLLDTGIGANMANILP